MSRKYYEPVFPFYSLAPLKVTYHDKEYVIEMVSCDHGIRMKTQVSQDVDGYIIDKTYCFGEGYWLSLPSLRQFVLSVLDGTEDDVETFQLAYDEHLSCYLPELLSSNKCTGFLFEELDRLNDVPSKAPVN